MKTADQPTYTWHADININGQPYPTRHPVPDHGPNSDAYHGDLTYAQRDHLRAVHEAAHAVASIAAGGHIHHAKITPTAELATRELSNTGIPSGDCSGCNLTDGQAVAVFLAAGERAEDHWLHQNKLWTPTRAAGIELGAYSDRQSFLALNPHFGFGNDHNDYRVVHDFADQLVTRCWPAITAVADVLAVRLHLTGDEIADLAHMPNGAPSATCTTA
ncbi:MULTISPECIES: hypothetical protein [Streptomyces]|uniref:Uncharacterized protein n=2 Tax=Streptomyces TaxID=1883 RepID=A0A2U9NZ06_STRAS|nr:hypothetical protein [Streptomyces actuosus]AWT42580.1 hypothetical protein DMT42_09805 [Streptomyces actuosus]MBM4819787.1 hypothetical protein [Streptomyces actuosus]